MSASLERDLFESVGLVLRGGLLGGFLAGAAMSLLAVVARLLHLMRSFLERGPRTPNQRAPLIIYQDTRGPLDEPA